MLMNFRFANHRSFRDENRLDFVPEYGDGLHEVTATPVAAVFGANASGKSNIINALAYMRRMAINSDRDSEPDAGVVRTPFKLDPEVAAEPSRYVVDLLLNGVRSTYGFTVDGERVLEEWLYVYPEGRRGVVFERTESDFSFGEEARRTPLSQVQAITAPNVLFLSVAARAGQELVIPVYNWFSREVHIYAQQHRDMYYRAQEVADRIDGTGRRSAIVDLLRAADLGLRDVFLVPAEDAVQLMLEGVGDWWDPAATRKGRGRRGSRRLVFKHAGAQGDVLLGWNEQSTGTQMLLELAITASEALHRGSLLVVDEIDASLHPVLTASLIGLFQNEETNGNGAQLLITTHDSTLLGSIQGSEVLRRDQIWFTQKEDDGASIVFPLSDFHPREHENRQRRYLNGSYGAVPVISDELFAKAVTSREGEW
ncbi:ATP/GTP-binding protein [Streptosporangium algeriense]|uniref:ATP/GTP-binding protein n=1 Tax=Streptosporangium algeriense TaxID=1682748 RepID=A0ABW3DK62_9ACTN